MLSRQSQNRSASITSHHIKAGSQTDLNRAPRSSRMIGWTDREIAVGLRQQINIANDQFG
jgi:hypothetical protein